MIYIRENQETYDSKIRAIFNSRPDMDFILRDKRKFTSKCGELGKDVIAYIDDMAQIIGEYSKVVEDKEDEIVRGLKNSQGIILRNGEAFTLGRSMEEAETAFNILEKSAEVNLKVAVLGGGVKVPSRACRKMREVYRDRYSLRNQEFMKGKLNNE